LNGFAKLEQPSTDRRTINLKTVELLKMVSNLAQRHTLKVKINGSGD
jgi:hypothetical protein